MIPILYDKNEIAFVSNGLGRLVDCVSCEVTEERNGVYECEFVYPMTGRFYQEMVENGGIISVIHDDAKDRQAFDIYKYSAPIDGLVTFNARHISYRLSGIPVSPFTAASCALALQGIKDNSVMPNPFTFWTDKVVSSTFTLDVPASARALLAGQQGSILDVYGKGEYKYNNFDVRLYVNRGVDSGVVIRYGKNLSNMMRENDKGDLYNAIVPYWKGESGVVTVPGYIVTAAGQTAKKCVPMDFSGEFSEEPTATQLQAAAENYLAENEPWAAFDNITVDFVQLWETEDYKDVAVLERCSLCDTVSVYFPALGVTNTHAKIIKVTYDVLHERYSSMELGSPQTTLSQAVLAPYQEAIDSIDEKASVSFLESAIQAATDLITGGLGGHVVIGRNADGEPNEILIMDTDDKATAVNVWRFNVNGLAHSHNGYNGPYSDIALTMDGKINADMITTGTLNAALATIINLSANSIHGGTLTVGGMNNQNGTIRILDSSGNEAGSIKNTQFYTHRTKNGILEEARLTSGYLQLVTDGTPALNLGRDTQGGGAISLRDAAGNPRIVMFAQNNSIELLTSERKAAINCQQNVLSFYSSNNSSRLIISPTNIGTLNADGKPDFRMSVGFTPDKKDIELFYVDTDYHDAVELGKTATAAHLRLYSPDNLHNIILDTQNGSIFKSPVTDAAGLTVQNGITADSATVNGLTAVNATVNGVLDVTQRRCYGRLSSPGWYRVKKVIDGAGAWSCSIDFDITRAYNYSNNEVHHIKMLKTYGVNPSFVNEISKTNVLNVTAIRYTIDGNGVGYVDIYYNSHSENMVTVDFTDHVNPALQQYFTAELLQYVDPSPYGETELARYMFAENCAPAPTPIYTVGSRTFASVQNNGDVFVENRVSLSPGNDLAIPFGSYGAALLVGMLQGVGGVVLGIVKNSSTIIVRDLMTNTNFSSSYVTFTLSGNTLIVSTTAPDDSILSVYRGGQ